MLHNINSLYYKLSYDYSVNHIKICKYNIDEK